MDRFVHWDISHWDWKSVPSNRPVHLSISGFVVVIENLISHYTTVWTRNDVSHAIEYWCAGDCTMGSPYESSLCVSTPVRRYAVDKNHCVVDSLWCLVYPDLRFEIKSSIDLSSSTHLPFSRQVTFHVVTLNPDANVLSGETFWDATTKWNSLYDYIKRLHVFPSAGYQIITSGSWSSVL